MSRLPVPGSDNGTWGNVLNDFLDQAHNSDGTLKPSAVSASGAATDSTVVHNTGAETIAGTKTFQASPVVPAPTLGSHATTKTYVDATVAAGAPDATTSSKGLVQLAGDLSGTYATPTVAKVNGVTVSGTPSNGQILTATSSSAASWQTSTASIPLTATTVQTTTYTASANQLIPCDTTAGGFTITLPTAPADKTRIVIKKIDSSTNAVTITLGGSDVFNKAGGSTNGTLSLPNQAITLQYASTGAIWYTTSDDLALSQLDVRYGRYEAARGQTPAAGILSALYRNQTTVIQLVSDSTAVFAGDSGGTGPAWFSLFGTKFGTAFSNYNVLLRSWNATNQTYDLPTTLQTGPNGLSKITSSGSSAVQFVGTNVATDIDVRIKLKPNSWASGGLQVPICKWNSVGNQRSWWFGITATGLLCFTWTTDGTSGTQVQKFSTVTNGLSAGSTNWIRATLQVNNGSSGNSLIFYTSSDGSSWSQLGSTVVTAGVTSIFAGSAPYQMTSLDSTFGSTCAGEVYWAEVRDGIGATGVSLVPPLPDTWDQASLSTSGTILIGGSPTLLLVNGSEGGQNLAYWSNATRKSHVLSPHAANLVITSSGHNEAYFTNGAWLTTLNTWQAIVTALVPNVPSCYLTQNPAKSPIVQNEIDVRARRGNALMTWARSQLGVYAIDTYLAFTDVTSQVSSDGTHPNAAGEAVWRDYVYKALLQLG